MDTNDKTNDIATGTGGDDAPAVPKKRGRPRLPDSERKANLPDRVLRARQVAEEEAGRGYGRPEGEGAFKYLDSVCEMRELPAVDLDDPDAVRERVDWYFRHCRDRQIKLSVAGLASALRVDRKTLEKWADGRNRNGQPHSPMIKNAKQDIVYALEAGAMDGNIDRVIAIFLLKNHGGYTDSQQITVDQAAPEFDVRSMDDVVSEYSDSAEGPAKG